MDEGYEEEEFGGPKVCRQCRAKTQLRSFDTRPGGLLLRVSCKCYFG